MILQLKFVPKKMREISPEEVEQLAASGLSRAEIAKRLKLNYEFFCRRLRNSLSLSNAYERGKIAAAEER